MFQTSPLLDIFLYLHSAFQNDDNRIVFHNSDILNKAMNCHVVIFRKIKTVGACFDTDCNGATVGSVLGTAIGDNAIPSYWKDRVNNTLESTLAGYGSVSIGDMAEKTLGFIKKN